MAEKIDISAEFCARGSSGADKRSGMSIANGRMERIAEPRMTRPRRGCAQSFFMTYSKAGGKNTSMEEFLCRLLGGGVLPGTRRYNA